MSNKKDKVITIILLLIMIILIYITAEQETIENKIKENRINNIENTLENHTHYIDKLEADVDNLKEVSQLKLKKKNNIINLQSNKHYFVDS